MWFSEGKFKFCHGDGHWAGVNKTLPASQPGDICMYKEKEKGRKRAGKCNRGMVLGCRV